MMVAISDPLATAFANTRSSTAVDRITTLEEFQEWARWWPALTGLLTGIGSGSLLEIRAQRDATQLVLHQLADGKSPSEEDLERATRCGLTTAPFSVRPARGRIAVESNQPDAVTHLLSRAVVDFVLSPQAAEVRRCQGAGCLKVFISSRPGRRWCDSRICGNRARVSAHARRRG